MRESLGLIRLFSKHPEEVGYFVIPHISLELRFFDPQHHASIEPGRIQ